MGYFDKLAAAVFKESENGQLLYFPNGTLGKGRVIPDEATRIRAVRNHKRWTMAAIFVGVPYGAWVGLSGNISVASFIPILVLTLFLGVWQHLFVRNLQVHHERLKYKEALAKSTQALPNWYYWMMGIMAVLSLGITLLMPFMLSKPIEELAFLMLLMGSLGLLCLGLAVKFYKLKNAGDQSGSEPSEFRVGSVRSVNPKILIAAVAVLAIVVFIKLGNPHRKYSTEEYWETATIDSVYEVPADALEPGNKNGSVLMWAAMGTDDPEIIAALVARGADVNEADVIFNGTPLTGAATYGSNPAIIDELIELGADVNQMASSRETALMVAVRFNSNLAIIERLLHHGADMVRVNARGRSAFEIAKDTNNEAAIQLLEAHAEQKGLKWY